jgi:hypothetical protein
MVFGDLMESIQRNSVVMNHLKWYNMLDLVADGWCQLVTLTSNNLL